MDVGDRVVYIQNHEIDLNRDLGTIVGQDVGRYRDFRVLFDDGKVWTVEYTDIKPLVDKRPPQKEMLHGHFGCLTYPCPIHNSTSDKEG